MTKGRFLLSAIIILLFLGLVPLSAAGGREREVGPPINRIQVVTSIFPLYDFSRQIGGELAEVKLLLPPGMEAHSFEPTPRDMVEIDKANLFVYMGREMEPWAESVVKGITNNKLVLINFSDEITGENINHEEVEEEDQGHAHPEGIDPHIWMNPRFAQDMVRKILEGFLEADPSNRDYYTERAELYIKQLDSLDRRIERDIQKVATRTILYGGHFAFGHFAHRYNLEHLSPYAGFSPNAEPTAQRLHELISKMKELNLKVVYHEELIEPRVARIIAQEAGADLMLLHSLHNVTKEELARGATYISLMEENLERLKLGLGYKE